MSIGSNRARRRAAGRCWSAADRARAEADVTPPLPRRRRARFSVRTRVHEYGGGAYLVDGGTVYFCNDEDQRIYRQSARVGADRDHPDPDRPRGLRYADGVMDGGRGRMIWVREDHTTGAPQPVNTLVEHPARRVAAATVLQSGRDFYAAPRLSPDRRRLAWLEWDHPNMPWIGCELWVAEIAERRFDRQQAPGRGRRRRIDLSARMVARRHRYISFRTAPRTGWTAAGGTCSALAATR